jgi:phosphate transport system permease protein
MASTAAAPATAPPDPFLRASLAGSRLPRWAPWGCAVGAVVVALLLAAVTPVSGIAGTAVVAALLFVAGQTGWSSLVEGRRHATDRLMTTLVYACFLLAITPLVWILVAVVAEGLQALDLSFLTHSMRNVDPRLPGGGVYHAAIGTLEVVGIASLIGIPIGILVAIYLVEYGRRSALARSVSFFVDVMTGVPSIVAGLFVYTFFVLALGFERSGFAGALSLAILMIPVMVRSTEEMLKLVPNELRESAYALGVPRYLTILRVVLPTALSGIVTGAMLSVARIAGETAPLLLTMFLSQSITTNPLGGPQATIPTFVWDQIGSGTNASIARAWAGALTLILLVMLLNLAARLIARRTRPQ